jgi:predicted nucleotidyltransferase
MHMNDPRLHRIVAAQPYPLVFATISGAHLYGFPSPDSDYDLRGVHVLPAREVVGLRPLAETLETSRIVEGLELDLVTHDIKKFCLLLLRKNGYVLEQLLSPLVVQTTPEHAALRELAPRLFTRYHAYHYLGFAATQWKLFDKERPRRVKPLLYVYRVLLTGLHLLRAGQLEANLLVLNDVYRLPYIPDLVERKLAGPEQGVLPDADLDLFTREYERLRAELQSAIATSHLPERPSAEAELHELLVRVRLES